MEQHLYLLLCHFTLKQITTYLLCILGDIDTPEFFFFNLFLHIVLFYLWVIFYKLILDELIEKRVFY
jgi:hypothetical protein